MAEHLDHLHYINDILCLRIDNLNEVLTDHLLNRLFIPLYIYSLVRNPVASNSIEVNSFFLSYYRVSHIEMVFFLILKKDRKQTLFFSVCLQPGSWITAYIASIFAVNLGDPMSAKIGGLVMWFNFIENILHCSKNIQKYVMHIFLIM